MEAGQMGSNLEPTWLQNSEVVGVESQLVWKGNLQSKMVD